MLTKPYVEGIMLGTSPPGLRHSGIYERYFALKQCPTLSLWHLIIRQRLFPQSGPMLITRYVNSAAHLSSVEL